MTGDMSDGDAGVINQAPTDVPHIPFDAIQKE